MEKRSPTSGTHPGTARESRAKQAYKRLRRLVGLVRLAVIGLALLFTVLLAVHLFVEKPDAAKLVAMQKSGTLIPGITINGIDVSGMTRAEAEETVGAKLKEAVSSINITVRHGSSLWVLTAADMAPATNLDIILDEAMLLGRTGTLLQNDREQKDIEETGRAYTAALVPDHDTLLSRLAMIGAALDTAPVEPYAEADSAAGTPTFVYIEGKDGYVLDREALFSEILALMEQQQYTATLTPELEYASPSTTVEDLKLTTQYRSEFQTSFGGSRAARNEKRVGNIQRAVTMLNGCKVEQGELFHFNAYIGPRTEKGGWPLAPGIVSGERYEDQAGGGICQVSTTLYNALLCSGASMQRGSTLDEIMAANIDGISITERRHHSWPSSYVDKGLDSTVTGTVESGKSLNFVNNTGAPVYIFAYCDQDNYTVTIYIYGAPLEEGITYKVRGEVDEELAPGEVIITEEPAWPLGYEEETVSARTGYKVTAYRDIYINGALDSTEVLYEETYNAVTGKKTVGTGDPTLPVPGASAN